MSADPKALQPLVRSVSARDIIMAAAASRDWQPQHHDADHARAVNLPGVIMNTPTQTGWFHAYALQCLGGMARIGRWNLKMLRPVYPGLSVKLSGTVILRRPADHRGWEWLWLDLEMQADEAVLSTMRLLLISPQPGADSQMLDLDAEILWPPLDCHKR